MTERPVSPTDDTIRKQQLAGHPQKSAWVSANAGSGKTHVLTTRVRRLLLTGSAPESILCLTYTKAAAAEMRARISLHLGKWAVMPDRALAEELAELTGSPPAAEELLRARTLFALALETPGGLKISTIHAFCESLLHRFPFEAGVPFNFEVIEDSTRTELIRRAREAVFTESLAGKGACAVPLETLFANLSDSQINEGIDKALSQMRKLRPVLADIMAAKANLRAVAGHDPADTIINLERRLEDQTVLHPGDVNALIDLQQGKPAGARFVDRLAAAANPENMSAEERLAAFLTAEGEPRSRLTVKDIRSRHPDLCDRFDAERDRVSDLHQIMRRTRLVERSEAFVDVLAAIVAGYDRRKRVGAYLDFDDLISRTTGLLQGREQSHWVRYKLDAGITHILVDESQDTNADQWQVVGSLAEEFFDGQGAVERQRSIFAVGDPKQSIFSFQGAEPQLFIEKGHEYRRRAAEARTAFEHIRLTASFRTLPAILEAVDKTFAAAQFAPALLQDGEAPGHESARRHGGGRVAIWPALHDESGHKDADRWPLLEDVETSQSAPRRNAERMALTIRNWLDAGRQLGSRGRAVRPEDILILVQSRGPQFSEIIRALKNQRIASPGADRLAVGTHIAVLDLLALGDVLLNTHDDLGLAALLRSPLFDVGEDDLLQIAYHRQGTLWQALGNSRLPSALDAAARLAAWRDRLDFDRPFEFYAHILYAGGGLRRFHARLGPEVDDVLAEFLDLALAHERSEQPSLQGFLVAMRERDVAIKRDLSEAGGGVRVMSVHGAKGLEAPIVILADATKKPQGSQTARSVYFGQTPEGPYFVHASQNKMHAAATLALRADVQSAEADEYWRKLYVAMTRAEDELHISGATGKSGNLDGTWYEAITKAVGDNCTQCEIAPGFEVSLYPADAAPDVWQGSGQQQAGTLPAQSAWPAVAASAPRVNLRPSDADVGEGGAARQVDALSSAAESLRDADVARRHGIALHALLQHLADAPPAERETIGRAALPILLPGEERASADILAKAIDILHDPRLQVLFAENSRAEIPVMAHGMQGSAPIRIAGRIDRLVIGDQTVLIVDYKSDAKPPPGLPLAYLRQLGLYAVVIQSIFPQSKVEAAILWTADRRLSYASAEQLAGVTTGISITAGT